MNTQVYSSGSAWLLKHIGFVGRFLIKSNLLLSNGNRHKSFVISAKIC